MSNEQASFDLIREKQELDTFLSTITAVGKTVPIEEKKEGTALFVESNSVGRGATIAVEQATTQPQSDAPDTLKAGGRSLSADDQKPQGSPDERERTFQQAETASAMPDQIMPAEPEPEKKQALVLDDAVKQEEPSPETISPAPPADAIDKESEEAFIVREEKEDLSAAGKSSLEEAPGQVVPEKEKEPVPSPLAQEETQLSPEKIEKTPIEGDRLELEERKEESLPKAGRPAEFQVRMENQVSVGEGIKAEDADAGRERDETTAISAPSIMPEADRTAKIEPAALPADEPEIETTVPLPAEEVEKTASEEPEKPKWKKGLWGSAWVRAAALFIVFIAATQGYLWMNPEAGQQAIQLLSSNVPFMDEFYKVEKSRQQIMSEQIKFINVKQRYVNNVLLGKVRVVEGTAVNHADYPVAKIKIMGELYDAKDTLLAARVSSCGNILADDKLGVLSEEEIRSALSIPQGSDLSNNKILPQGKISFMIVFTREPAGVVKTTIMPMGVEKTSP